MKRLLYILLMMSFCFQAQAQNSKKVKDLQKKREQLQRDISKSQNDLNQNKKDVKKHKSEVQQLEIQVQDRVLHIQETESEIARLDSQSTDLQNQIVNLEQQLDQKRALYARSLRLARANRGTTSSTVYVLSAQTVSQMYRRSRLARDFATYQRELGEGIIRVRDELTGRREELLVVRTQQDDLRKDLIEQRQQLTAQQLKEQQAVAGLEKQQKELEKQMGKQQKELAQLNKKIDDLVAAEVEAARKRAEEARRKAEAKNNGKNSGKGGGKNSGSSSGGGSSSGSSSRWLTPEEKALNGTFEQNKGRLPVPITGQYKVGRRFGTQSLDAHVQMDNKGTNYIGQSGAKARSIFDGEVTAISKIGARSYVLIRHGSYISVYGNLSSISVSKGQKVKARDVIGAVGEDGNGTCTLLFQLRKETAKMNPEQWIGR